MVSTSSDLVEEITTSFRSPIIFSLLALAMVVKITKVLKHFSELNGNDIKLKLASFDKTLIKVAVKMP